VTITAGWLAGLVPTIRRLFARLPSECRPRNVTGNGQALPRRAPICWNRSGRDHAGVRLIASPELVFGSPVRRPALWAPPGSRVPANPASWTAVRGRLDARPATGL